MRLKRLAIHKYRHVRPGTVLEFADGVNVLLGRNGTGKTTLLNLIAMIARSDFSPLKGEDFKFDFTLDIDGATLEVAVEGAAPAREEPLLDSGSWAYRGRFAVAAGAPVVSFNATRGKPIEFDPPLVPSNASADAHDLFRRQMLSSLVLASAEATGDGVALSKAAPLLNGDLSAGRFDEALEVFRAITTGRRSDAAQLPAGAQFRSVATGQGKSAGDSASFIPLEVVARLHTLRWTADGAADHLVVTHRNIDLLERIRGILRVLGIAVTPNWRQRRPFGRGTEDVYEGINIAVDIDGRSIVHHDLLSFGQKRLIAFFWYLACNPKGVIIADELVNGFHYDWVEACLDEIGDRQAFIASQNPLLLDFMGFESADDVRRAFVLCTLEPDPAGGSIWSWRNMGEAEADEFFRAYDVGIQHVSEILRTKGLW
jgi:energy-coupling factor transporter ATP-binding protein EcfA2